MHLSREVLPVSEEANRRDARRARTQDFTKIVFRDAADGDERERRERAGGLS